jgi:hypothetical protein
MDVILNATEDELCQMHRIVWQPGRYLHPDWWEKWHMSPQKTLYFQASPALCRRIDARIIEQSGLSDWQTKSLTDMQKMLIRLQPKMPTLLIAMGLISLGSSGYLRFRHYRQHLEELFSFQQLRRLSMLMRKTDEKTEADPEQLLERSLLAGLSILDPALQGEPLWQRLRLMFPCERGASPMSFFPGCPVRMLLRLERFL